MSGICFPTQHFYPRPPRGGRHGRAGILEGLHAVSIHALREEGDLNSRKFVFHGFNVFLSTPSARRATPGSLLRADAGRVSIHALREEGDYNAFCFI